MNIHPLKLISLISISGLILIQSGLYFWLQTEAKLIIAGLLTVPLLIPLKGLISNRRYTFKWIGFLTLLYFCIGVSESFANPALRLYSVLTIIFSVALFSSSIYYSRYLRVHG